ncbi:MAG: DNA-directed RNA polymerase subunit beta' [Actinobacteria bacterium]|nr:DNA-directed RNA polymerase subunit beta' [Actinomycetota bacterium]
MGAETVRELLRDLDTRITLDQQYDKFSGLKAKEKEDKTKTPEEKKADEEKERKELRDIFARLNGKDAPIELMVQMCELRGRIRAGGLTEKEVDDKLKRIEKQKESGKASDKKKLTEDKKRLAEIKKLYEKVPDLRAKVEKEMEAAGKEKGADVHEANKLGLEAEELRWTIRKSQGQKRNKASKRLKVVSSFLKTYNKPEAMIMDVIPVIPPDLRPMVQLDGGRFATSDLNDLYRRVINRNNRLTRLNELGAPEIIVNNEKRMLQEAVDALFDNGRRGRPVTGPGNRPLKSLSDMLKGKQGRFRQNLLGKRVDYSGRSVIVVGPELKLHQCGLPKQMALELFKPFVMKRLVDLGFAHNIKGAKRMIDRMIPIVWDVLEKVIHEHPVLLNRAPTLHRLGIQAFEPMLVEGKALRIHPLVCTAFNADFDGDQMAVHLPLSAEAQAEARILMLSAQNILSPAHGKPIVTPTQDMVLGCWFLTAIKEGAKGTGKVLPNEDYAILATEYHGLDLQALIKVRTSEGEMLETTAGRLIFNRALPDDFPYQNRVVGKKEVAEIVEMVADRYESDVIVRILDQIKETGFHYSTRAGITIGVEDIEVPPDKQDILDKADTEVSAIEERYRNGFYTEEERHERVVDVWHGATDMVAKHMEDNFDDFNPIYMMARSGARGDLKQIKQLAGMKGLVEDPKGDIIASPITSNFREGLSVLEYFISTHGARKGLADTALRTADSGYLTRRLVDVAQDVIVREEDCETDRGIPVRVMMDGELNPSLLGRLVLEDLKAGRSTLVKANVEINKEIARKLADAGIEEVRVRSVLTCRAKHGVCSSCYGRNMATGKRTPIGEAVGIVAAQSIGEPGTQLTMRTFHFGGVYTGAGRDITHGLPRVVELFEARKPKGLAHLAPSRGRAEVIKGENKHQVILHGEKLNEKTGKMEPFEYPVFEPPASQKLLVSDGDEVAAGQQLTEGSADPKELLEILDRESVQLYLVSEVQKVYKDQGVDIHDKHIEIIVRQMLKRVTVSEPGDSDFLPGQLVDYMQFEVEADSVVADGGQPPTFKEVLLGITKASLATDSFLSAASFQETTRVLTDAALSGKVDNLMGLKENVIIGKLIPTGSGMKRYRRINVKPKGEEWDSLYTGEVSLEPQPQFTDIDSLAQVFGDDFEDVEEEEVDTDVE